MSKFSWVEIEEENFSSDSFLRTPNPRKGRDDIISKLPGKPTEAVAYWLNAYHVGLAWFQIVAKPPLPGNFHPRYTIFYRLK